MNPLSVTTASYPVHDYKLVIRPSESVKERLAHVKNRMRQRYQLHARQLGLSHILLASFSQYAAMEEKMVHRFQQVMAGIPPFKIQLHNLTNAPGHSIHLDVPLDAALQYVLSEVRRQQWLMRMPMQQPFIISVPSIELAHNLSVSQFDAMWRRMQHRHFTASFIASDMLLLRRRRGERSWQILSALPFQNMPVLARQAVLF